MISLLRLLFLFTLFAVQGSAVADSEQQANGIRLMTLNVSHGRAQSLFQIYQSEDKARSNLIGIARIISREQPLIVAFQEIDRNSFWNGHFDHGQFIADQASYNHWFSGSHQLSRRLDYGTGLMSKIDLEGRTSISFDRPFARTRKGFVLSTIDWPEKPGVTVDLVSLHLDPVSRSERRRELNKMLEVLEQRDNLRIIMGDFNMEYEQHSALIADLLTALNLHTWKPYEQDLVTYPLFGKRLDWILVSREFEFLKHEVLDDPVSDHKPVLVEVTLL